MTDLFDSEPEDSFDAGDPVLVRLDNVRRRVITLHHRLDDVLEAGERLRFDMITEDLATIVDELRDG